MKATKTIYAVAALCGAFACAASAQQSDNRLLLLGAIESINPANQTIRILGHDVKVANVTTHSVGHVVSVFGAVGTGMQISAIADSKSYATGAEVVMLSGVVTKANTSTGRIYVDGAGVDITPLLSNSAFSMPAQGSVITVLGTQPSLGGVVLAASIAHGIGVTSGGVPSVGVTSGGVPSVGVTSGGFQSVGVTSGGFQSVGVTSGGFQSVGVTSGGVPSVGVTSGGFQSVGVTSGGVPSVGVTSGGVPSVGVTSGKSAI